MSTASPAPAPPRPAVPSFRSLAPRVLMLAVGAVAGMAGGRMIGQWLRAGNVRDAIGAWDLLALPVAWLLAVLVHEGGHVLAGLWSGHRFVLMTAGPFRIGLEDGRLRVRYNDQPALWGGLALLVPSDLERFHERARILIAGGPLASLVLALLAGGLCAVSEGRALFWLAVVAFMSGAIAVATLIPSNIGGFASDGEQLLALGRKDPLAETRALLAVIAGASLAGTRPRDYDARIVERISTLDGPPNVRLASAMLVGLHALDRGEPAEPFFELVPAYFLEIPAGIRQGYAAWMVWYHATVRADAAMAAQWADAAKGGIVDPALRALADASLAFANRDAAGCRAAVARGLAGSAGLDPGATKLIRDLLRALAERLEEPPV